MGKTEKQEKANKKQKHFWKDFKAELKKVIWPTRSQVVNNTIIVISIVLLVTAIVFVLDLAFKALNTYGINKLKTTVQNSVVSDEGENNENENNENQEATNAPEEGTENNNGEENNADNNEATNAPENNADTPDDVTDVENNN